MQGAGIVTVLDKGHHSADHETAKTVTKTIKLLTVDVFSLDVECLNTEQDD